jgi:phospholipid/cholesterol/gamma-HCH transport system permease protein
MTLARGLAAREKPTGARSTAPAEVAPMPAGRGSLPGRVLAKRALARPANQLEEVGEMMLLTGRTVSSALRPPYPYGGEFVSQFLFVLRLCWLPLLVSTVCIDYAAPGLQGANLLTLFGALDRLGGFFVLGSIREIGPFVTAIVVGGVAGTAITADLGARKIREELDALQVLGVDPVKNLVVPRFLALMLATGLFNVYAILFGIFGGLLAERVNHYPLGPFWNNLFANANTTDLWGSALKATIYGAIIAIVCCYKGLTSSGGAEGVGRAVNQAVVLSFLAFGSFDYVFTQTLLATHPQILVIK